MTIITPEEAAELLQQAAEDAGGQVLLGEKIGEPNTAICDMIHGRRALSKKVLKHLGLTKTVRRAVFYVLEGDENNKPSPHTPRWLKR